MHIHRKFSFYLLMFVFLITLFSVTPVLAYMMSSTNYRIQFDSINTGGGMGTSTNFKIEDTVGEVATGNSSSTSYNLYAGYQNMDQNTTLSITAPSSVVLLPSIGGLTGGTADGQSAVAVSTNGSSGYSLYVNASSNPALASASSSFNNLSTTNNTPNFNWQVPATSSAFGFTPEGTDIVTRFRDSGPSCNQVAGSDSAFRCWDYLPINILQISQSAASNYPSYTTTTLYLRAESGTQNVQAPGSYSASIVVTAHVN